MWPMETEAFLKQAPVSIGLGQQTAGLSPTADTDTFAVRIRNHLASNAPGSVAPAVLEAVPDVENARVSLIETPGGVWSAPSDTVPEASALVRQAMVIGVKAIARQRIINAGYPEWKQVNLLIDRGAGLQEFMAIRDAVRERCAALEVEIEATPDEKLVGIDPENAWPT